MPTKLPTHTTQLHSVCVFLATDGETTVKRKRARQEHVQISVSDFNSYYCLSGVNLNKPCRLLPVQKNLLS